MIRFRIDRRIFLLIVVLISGICSTFPGDFLREGTWLGTYQPPESGDVINASFHVRRSSDDEEVSSELAGWVVDMVLDLSPPFNNPRPFREIVEDLDGLHFILDIDPPLGCHLTPDGSGILRGLCHEHSDRESESEGPSATIMMRPPAEEPAEENSSSEDGLQSDTEGP